ncbi:hypothetical protein N9V13_06505 [Betaproteobacteria bacterium]|nr:hypothetical protein [Betaproteobacteria bacterium]
MKKEEKTEKDNTARSILEKNNSPKGSKEDKGGQFTSVSNNNNSESAGEGLSRKNDSFVRFSGKNTIFICFLIVAIGVAVFGYVYRDQVKTVLPNELTELFTGSSQLANIDTQGSIQKEMGIDEMEKSEINADISELSIEEPNTDQADSSAIDQYETDSSIRPVEEAELVSKDGRLEGDEILHSEKVPEGVHLDVSEDREKTLRLGNSDALAIVKEIHKITVEIEDMDFTKNFPVEDNPVLGTDHSNNDAISEKLLESLKGLIQIRKIKDYEGLSLNQESEKSLKNQFVINLISGKTMLITGFNAEALDDIKRARKILNLFYASDEENVQMMIGRLDEIIYQVKEMD